MSGRNSSAAKALISTVPVVEVKMVVHCRRGLRAVIFVDWNDIEPAVPASI
jgi:hypothetical protein